MADEDIQPIVCDNGTGMIKVVILHEIPFKRSFFISYLIKS
jgi:hypothetical protein